MNIPIDNIFTSNSYRYIPVSIRNEWKTLNNNYSSQFYKKLNKNFEYNHQAKIGVYNEQKERLKRVLALIQTFEKKIDTFKVGEYGGNQDYCQSIKDELRTSLTAMKEFALERQRELDNEFEEKKIPIKQIENDYIEHFTRTNSSKKPNKLLIIIFIIVFFYIVFH